MKSRPTLPQGHGEVLSEPPYSAWTAALQSNARASAAWTFEVAGSPVTLFRDAVRREALEVAVAFSRRMGVPVRADVESLDRVVVTGHQPEFYHPGVWVKDFLLQRCADENDAVAIDLVVDTDSFAQVALRAPSLEPTVSAFTHPLAMGSAGRCYATAPLPTTAEIDEMCERGSSALSTLPTPAPVRHFGEFCTHLRAATGEAENLAELVTIARRRFEASAGSDYLELPVSALSRTRSFARYVVDIMLSAERFAQAYNDELGAYRTIHKTRSAAQPFPDLSRASKSVEVPFWYVTQDSRRTLAITPVGESLELAADGERIALLPREPASAVETLLALPGLIAPKAIALTLFARMFMSDLFIHGVGGGRYDRIADGVITRYYGQEPPAFVVASMTMYLPLGAPIVGDEEVVAAEQQLHRFEHNPDEALKGTECESLAERDVALSLSQEKEALIAQIAQPTADKKTLGLRIREVNQELRELLAPVEQQLRADLERLKSEREATEILVDRTYPFCLWAPTEIRDKVL